MEAAKGGECVTNQEIEQAVVDNKKLVYFVVHRYYPDFIHDDDIIQVGWIGLWKARISYDSSKSKFSTFAVRCIANEIKMEFRDRAKSQNLGSMVSLDEPLYIDEETGSAVTLANTIPDTRDDYCAVDYDLSFLERKISERDTKVFRLSTYGFTAAEIGRAFGLSRTRVCVIINQVRKMAKASLRPRYT